VGTETAAIQGGSPAGRPGVGAPAADPARALGAAGYRWTHQRQVVLDVLRGAGTHLDADQIYQLARRRATRLSLSTVYRTVAVLRRQGLVRELRLGEGRHRYECGPGETGRPEHGHLICGACARVVEFTNPHLDRLQRDLQRRYHFRFDAAEVEITATCEACQSRAAAAESEAPLEAAPAASVRGA